jgi:dTDP-4-amino-4,6-dideoxygalactose transaminase
MEYKYPVASPCFKGNERKYLEDVLNSGIISSQGKYIPEFERDFADYNGSKHGVACSSGTAALTIAVQSLHLNPTDEIIVPEFTMVASAWAVEYGGAKPVFVDCKDDLNIDVDKIEKRINERTKAIMPVHVYGRKCDMDRIMDISRRYNLRVIEDSAESHGIKPTGDIACFSLYGNKIITAGEGGIAVTNDDSLDYQMRHLRSMAFSADHDFLHPKRANNFRMTNLQAAVAKAQLEQLPEFLQRRREIEGYYNNGLTDVKGVKLMPKRDVVWFYDVLVEKRAELQKHLKENGIETRQFFKPMSRQPMYSGNKEITWKNLNANKFGETGIYLPTYVELTPEDQNYIMDKIKEFYSTHRD